MKIGWWLIGLALLLAQVFFCWQLCCLWPSYGEAGLICFGCFSWYLGVFSYMSDPWSPVLYRLGLMFAAGHTGMLLTCDWWTGVGCGVTYGASFLLVFCLTIVREMQEEAEDEEEEEEEEEDVSQVFDFLTTSAENDW